jgi:hypothetical protein
VFRFNGYLAYPVSVSWNVCWISAGGCICNGRKETAEIAKRLWIRRCSTARHGTARHGLLRELQVEGGSRFRNFIWITNSSLEILPQKIGLRIQRKDTKFRAAFPLLIGFAITLRHLANSDLSVSFSSAAFVLADNKI